MSGEEQKASYSFPWLSQFWVKIFDTTGHKEQTVIPSNDHAPIISNQKFFINFKKCVVRTSIKNWNEKIKRSVVFNSFAHIVCATYYIYFYHDYWKSTILHGPSYMPNIYLAYNKVTYSNAWFLWKLFKPSICSMIWFELKCSIEF